MRRPAENLRDVFPPMIDGLLWFSLTLLPLVFLQRILHREIQTVFLILTRDHTFTIGLFSILFFPGVLIHEFSHFLMARLLGVRTGEFSLIPQVTGDGRVILGYVDTDRADLLRDSLIGFAPLLSGGLLLAFVAAPRLGLPSVWAFALAGQFDQFWQALALVPSVPDFSLWFYFTFAVSSTMLPSAADRHAWAPLGLAAAILIAGSIFAGAGPWMLEHVAPPLDNFLRATATIFGLSAVIHILLLLPTYLTHRILSRITHLDVQ